MGNESWRHLPHHGLVGIVETELLMVSLGGDKAKADTMYKRMVSSEHEACAVRTS